MLRHMDFDDKLKLIGKFVCVIGWAMSIYFSAEGFGLRGGPGTWWRGTSWPAS